MICILEVATIFEQYSVMQSEDTIHIAINSFPAESFTAEEQAVFDEFYADVLGDKGIIEILEYTALDIDKWQSKKNSINRSRFNIALDDFGTGNNNMMAVDIFAPHIVKLDRSLITDIENDVDKQEYYYYRDSFHKEHQSAC
ncbi:MAG: EAL domain-containing protein [Lachnospira eligens]